MSNLQVLAKAKILNCPVDAAYEKKGNGNVMVVYGKTDPATAEWISFNELITMAGNIVATFTDQNALQNALPTEVANILDKIQFRLRQVYYLKNSETGSTGTKANDYAFWLDLRADKLTDGWPVAVETVSIKIYTTTNQTILDEMGINATKKLLGAA